MWFRLPVDSDHFNLSWAAFQKVMKGEAPTLSISAEIRQPDPGLYEVWINNFGEYTPAQEVQFKVQWKANSLLAYDVIGEHKGVPDYANNWITIHGPAPREKTEPVLAAWFRARSDFKEEKEIVKCNPVSLIH
jgi:hypothetical protein